MRNGRWGTFHSAQLGHSAARRAARAVSPAWPASGRVASGTSERARRQALAIIAYPWGSWFGPNVCRGLRLHQRVAEEPLVAERVAHAALPLAMVVVLGRAHHGGARGYGAAGERVDVVHVEVQRGAGAAVRERAQDAEFGVLVGEHHRHRP